MIRRTCVWCSNPFEVDRPTSIRIYCSSNCKSNAANKAMRQRRFEVRPTTCAECGGKLEQNEVGRPKTFCSDKCKTRAHNRKANRKRLPLTQVSEKTCPHCGKTFTAKRRNRIYCYDSWCVQYAYQARRKAGEAVRQVEHDVTCYRCGTVFTAKHPKAKWCSTRCSGSYWSLVASRQRKQASSADYVDREVFDRDGWRCHICGDKVDRMLPRSHSMGATIDHLVPLSQGGEDRLSNVGTAHRSCNVIKGNRCADDQLRLM